MDLGNPVGTIQAHGRTWPTYERPAFSVDVVGQIDAKEVESAEQVAVELRAALDRYGVTVRVYPVNVLSMSPEDQAEKTALDEKAIAAAFS